MLKAENKKITSCMPKTAVPPNFKAHQLGCQNDKCSSDKTSEKKKNFKKIIKFCPKTIITQQLMLN